MSKRFVFFLICAACTLFFNFFIIQYSGLLSDPTLLTIVVTFGNLVVISFICYKLINSPHGRAVNKVPSRKGGEVERLLEEERIINREQLSEIDLLKEQENYRREFLGNVSHELKTPLFSIQGFLLTLIEGGLNDPKIRDKYLDRINKSVERLIYITRDLELLSEVEHGNLELDMKSFNMRALVQDVFDLLELKAANNQVELRFHQLYDSPVRVLGDMDKLERVLINLIANAINHSGKPATLTVVFEEINEYIQTKIIDDGVGIKPDDLKRIFERFYRADKSRSRVQGGSGIGLSIVKHILEAHGQHINVKSEFGKGTEFSFLLPKA